MLLNLSGWNECSAFPLHLMSRRSALKWLCVICASWRFKSPHRGCVRAEQATYVWFEAIGQLTRVNVTRFSLNPENEPQQGGGKWDVLIKSHQGTSQDTTGTNCLLDVFFFPFLAGSVVPRSWTWGWRVSMTIIDADLNRGRNGEKFQWMPDYADYFHFSSAFLVELPVSLSCLWKERTVQSFIPEVVQLMINFYNMDINVESIWSNLPQFVVNLMWS